MSIFHVLKYPLSSPPTLEELKALPTELLTNLKESHFSSLDLTDMAEELYYELYGLNSKYTSQADKHKKSNLLKLIKQKLYDIP